MNHYELPIFLSIFIQTRIRRKKRIRQNAQNEIEKKKKKIERDKEI